MPISNSSKDAFTAAGQGAEQALGRFILTYEESSARLGRHPICGLNPAYFSIGIASF